MYVNRFLTTGAFVNSIYVVGGPVYRQIHCVKFSESNGDLLEYNGSQGANGLD